MSTVSPAPSASRGEVILQPTYFTSSVYVRALRDDITTLIHAYHEQYTHAQPEQPFALFKSLWSHQGWQWLHFKVFDRRTRETFLNVTLRLFLERTFKTEAPFTRAIALFGLYTFFYTQPLETAPPLLHIAHIPIPIDHYSSLKTLPGLLNTAYLHLQPAASYVLTTLFDDRVFFILPRSDLGPLNPRDLPREVDVFQGTIIPVDPTAPKKKGRPTRRDKAKKAMTVLDSLDKWLEKTAHPASLNPTTSESTLISESETMRTVIANPTTTLQQYQSEKSKFLNTIVSPYGNCDATDGRVAVEQANQFVLDRLKAAEELVFANESAPTTQAGLKRVECAVQDLTDAGLQEPRWGILGLLDGAGITQP